MAGEGVRGWGERVRGVGVGVAQLGGKEREGCVFERGRERVNSSEEEEGEQGEEEKRKFWDAGLNSTQQTRCQSCFTRRTRLTHYCNSALIYFSRLLMLTVVSEGF